MRLAPGAVGPPDDGGIDNGHAALRAVPDPLSDPAAGSARPQWPSLQIAGSLAEEYGAAAEPHTSLPSERVLAERFGVQRPTVRVALEYLAQQGLIYRRERLGWFVSPPRLEYDLLGPGVPRERLRIDVVTTDPAGQPAPPHPGLRFAALRKYYFDERLVVVSHAFLRADMRKALTDAELATPLRDSFAMASRRCGVDLTHNRISVTAAVIGPELAPVLEVAARQPVLDVTRIRYSHDDVVGADLEHWRSDVVTLTFEDQRNRRHR